MITNPIGSGKAAGGRADSLKPLKFDRIMAGQNHKNKANPHAVSGGMILPKNRRFEIPFFFPGVFFRLFS
jgi:hypothetical protein